MFAFNNKNYVDFVCVLLTMIGTFCITTHDSFLDTFPVCIFNADFNQDVLENTIRVDVDVWNFCSYCSRHFSHAQKTSKHKNLQRKRNEYQKFLKVNFVYQLIKHENNNLKFILTFEITKERLSKILYLLATEDLKGINSKSFIQPFKTKILQLRNNIWKLLLNLKYALKI